MVDIVDKATRSRMMAGIGGKNTRPEMAVRKHLFAAGFRYRLHRRDLPGRPDIVLPKYQTVIFVHGCFWHRHAGCRFAATPATNAQFWQDKLDGNVERDRRSTRALRAAGWRVLRVWACRTGPKDLARLVTALEKSRQSPQLLTSNTCRR